MTALSTSARKPTGLDGLSLADFLNRVFQPHNLRSASRRECKSYRDAINWLERFLGRRAELPDLSPEVPSGLVPFMGDCRVSNSRISDLNGKLVALGYYAWRLSLIPDWQPAEPRAPEPVEPLANPGLDGLAIQHVTPTAYLDLPLLELLKRSYVPEAVRLSSPLSLADYELQIRHFNTFFRQQLALQPGAAPRDPALRDLSDSLVRAAMEWQIGPTRKRKRETANKLHRVICLLWRHAYNELRIVPAPPRVKQFQVVEHTRTAWTPEEFQLILDQPDKMPEMQQPVGRGVTIPLAKLLKVLCALIANCGGRITAIMLAAPGDFDPQRKTLKLSAENQKHREDQIFHLHDEVCDSLQELLPGQWPRLIPWPYDQNWDTDNCTWHSAGYVRDFVVQGKWRMLITRYREVLNAAGLRDSRKDLFHGIRACVATWICNELGEVAASQYLGHSGVQVTRAYLDYSQINYEKSAVHALPKFQLKTCLASAEAIQYEAQFLPPVDASEKAQRTPLGFLMEAERLFADGHALAAAMTARVALERSLFRATVERGCRRKKAKSISCFAKALLRVNAIDEETHQRIRRYANTANRAAHGSTVEQTEVAELIVGLRKLFSSHLLERIANGTG